MAGVFLFLFILGSFDWRGVTNDRFNVCNAIKSVLEIEHLFP